MRRVLRDVSCKQIHFCCWNPYSPSKGSIEWSNCKSKWEDDLSHSWTCQMMGWGGQHFNRESCLESKEKPHNKMQDKIPQILPVGSHFYTRLFSEMKSRAKISENQNFVKLVSQRKKCSLCLCIHCIQYNFTLVGFRNIVLLCFKQWMLSQPTIL